MYENPDENRQMHVKCLPFFKIFPIYAWKITLFSWIREFAPTLEKYPFIRESGYERGIRFDREERGISNILQRQVNGNHDIDNGCIMGISGSALRVICCNISNIVAEISKYRGIHRSLLRRLLVLWYLAEAG